MRLQGVVRELGQVARLQLVDKCAEVAGDEPDVSVVVFGYVAYAVELFVVGGQLDFLPFRLEVFLVKKQAVLEGMYPNAVVAVYVDFGEVLP